MVEIFRYRASLALPRAGAARHPGVYTRGVGAFTRAVGVYYTQGVLRTRTPSRKHRFLQIQVRACTVTSPNIMLPTSFETRQTPRGFRFKLQDYLFLKKINPLQGNAITIHSMSMTLGV